MAGYLQEAYEYYQEQWSRAMYKMASRRFVIKAGTLAALGGATAMSQLMEACAGGAAKETSVGSELAAGSFKYSRFPMVEQYNWRLVKWDMTPYYGGTFIDQYTPPNNWDMLKTSRTTPGGRPWQTLYRLHYGPPTETPGWPVEPMNYEDTDHKPFRVEPHAAAEMPKIAPDFSYYEVKLRPDLFFHYNPGADTTPEVKALIEKIGGRNVTADDVKYMYDTFQDKKASLFYDNLEYVDRTDVVDKYTLRFQMTKPVVFFTQVMASPYYYIFAPEHHQSSPAVWQAWAIGTGPFMLQYYKYQDHMEFLRHPKFTEVDRGGFRQPYVDKLLGYYLADVNVSKAAMRSNQIDQWYTSGLEVFQDLLTTNPELIAAVIPQDPNVQTIYDMNWRNPVWGKSEAGLKMRRALSMSIDRRGLNEIVYGGAGVPAYSTPYAFMGLEAPAFWDELGPYYEYNPTEAKRLMAEAGFPNGYDIEMLRSQLATSQDLDTAMQQQMAEAGFRLTIKDIEDTARTNARNTGDFKDLTAGSQDAGYDMEMNIWRLWGRPDSSRNYGAVDDAILQDLALKQRYELDFDTRTKIAQQVHQRFLDIIPTLNVVSAHHWILRHPWLHNTQDNTFSWLCCWGSQQSRQAYVDDTTPNGRGGTRGKEGTWGVPYDRQGRKV
jgi:peptide/nickel transport system substrate-binding protein